MRVINSHTNKVAGIYTNLEDIQDSGIKKRFAPFVRKFKYLIYKDKLGNFRLGSKARYKLLRALEK